MVIEPNGTLDPRPLLDHESTERTEFQSTDLKKNLARRDGSWSVYSYYARKAGLLHVILFAALLLAYGFTTQFTCKIAQIILYY